MKTEKVFRVMFVVLVILILYALFIDINDGIKSPDSAQERCPSCGNW